VFDGRLDYVASYQTAVDGVLSYPLYFALRDVFVNRQSMKKFEQLVGPVRASVFYFC
jgi:hypothetical protein